MSNATPQFRLFTSNNLTDLGQAYAVSRLKDPEYFHGNSFFAAERACVATQGMATWLEHFLVKQGHVVANIQFPFIRNVIDEILAAFMKDQAEEYHPELFQEDVLIWRIYHVLQHPEHPTELHMLSNYVEQCPQEAREARRYQLAKKLAQIYYDYIAFVPEKLHPNLALKKSELADGDKWQLTLWQELCVSPTGEKLVSPAEALLRFISNTNQLKAESYTPLSFFGISAMAPYFLMVLKKLSTVQPVNFFYLNHCDELWDDVKANWEKRSAFNSADKDEELDNLFNNTLLGNFGIQGREFFKAIMDLGDDVQEINLGEYKRTWEATARQQTNAHTENTLLHDIQQRILHNTNDSLEEAISQNQDDSLTIHSCFNEMRQVETLQDCLLKLIKTYKETNTPLCMNDIIVMAPDISSFAPTIRAVFDQGPLKNKYCISDRSVMNANLMAEAFNNILGLHRTKFEITRINRLLDSPPLRTRFGLNDDDVSTLRDWFEKSNIHWGRDAQDRAVGRQEEYTWQYGLDRMLLKLALDQDQNAQEPTRFQNITPLDYNTGTDKQQLLNSLITLYRQLQNIEADLKDNPERSPKEWHAFLLNARNAFFLPNQDSAQEYAQLGYVFTALENALTTAGYDDNSRLHFSVIQSAIESVLMSPAKGEPFLNGKITFCSLLPMRGIPCKIIALLGLDTGTFPRQNDCTGFNLVSRRNPDGTPAAGNLMKYYNRSINIEDRFTFLEALMSAQDFLMLFYNGQDDINLKELVAAAPVNELLEYVRSIRGLPSSTSWPVVQERLNVFDAKNFHGTPAPAAQLHTGALLRPGSFDSKMCRIANDIQAATSQDASAPFWKECYKLPIPEQLPNGWKNSGKITITLQDLERFLKNPAQAYLVSRLGMDRLPWDAKPLSDYEPFDTNALERSQHKRMLETLQLKDAKHLEPLALEPDFTPQKLPQETNLPLNKDYAKVILTSEQIDSWFTDSDIRAGFKAQLDNGESTFEFELGHLNPQFIQEIREIIGKYIASFEHLPSLQVTLKAQFSTRPDNAGVMYCAHSSTVGKHYIPFYLRHLCLCAQQENNPTPEAKTPHSYFLSKAAATAEEMSGFPPPNYDFYECLVQLKEALEEVPEATNIPVLAPLLHFLTNACDEITPAITASHDGILKALNERLAPETYQNRKVALQEFINLFTLNDCDKENNIKKAQSLASICRQYNDIATNIKTTTKTKLQHEALLQAIDNWATTYQSFIDEKTKQLLNYPKADEIIHSIPKADTTECTFTSFEANRSKYEWLRNENRPATEQLQRLITLYIWGQLYPLPLFREVSPNIAISAGGKTTDLAKAVKDDANNTLLFDTLPDDEDACKAASDLAKYCYHGLLYNED